MILRDKTARRKLLTILRIVVSLGLLVYLIRKVDPARLAEVWRGVALLPLLLALLLLIGGVFVSALKWWLLLRAVGVPVPYLWTVRTYFIGQFFNNFLPTMVGGDGMRIYLLHRRIGRPATAIASVFVERVTGFMALNVIAAVALALSFGLFGGASRLAWAAFWVIIVASMAIAVALAAPIISRVLLRLRLPNPFNWRGKLDTIASALAAYYAFRRTLLVVIGLSFVYQLSLIIANFAVVQALHLAVPFSFVALMTPLSDIIGLVPIFFNNIGARDGTFVVLLGQLGTPAALALALSFLVLVLRLIVSLIGGAIYVLDGLLGANRTRPDDVQVLE